MDSACLPALARIGLAVLPAELRDRLRRLEAGELDVGDAERTVADLDLMAGMLVSSRGPRS